MEKKMSFLSILLLFSLTTISTEVYAQNNNGRVRLFVFGDSYVDAGNWNQFSLSWLPPYGLTYPGKPSGRFSDGRVLSDYIASYLGIESPIPYRFRQSASVAQLKNGMNFAYGGTGVFTTMVPQPNLGQQIDLFQQLIGQNLYTKEDLDSSVALVSIAGNDYAIGTGRVPSPTVTGSIINQLAVDLKRIKDLGVRKVAVTAIEAVGCLPASTALMGYLSCNELSNTFARNHNQLLSAAVQNLNSKSGGSFVIIDLYNAFLDALQKQNRPGILIPCCGGATGGMCSSFTVCPNPQSSFFWDVVHPSQHGWESVYEALVPSLGSLRE